MSVTDIPANFPEWWRVSVALFWVALALGFQGLTVLMVYEAIAIFTRAVPTISFITSYEFLRHPIWWVVIACVISFVFGALVTHFTHWTP